MYATHSAAILSTSVVDASALSVSIPSWSLSTIGGAKRACPALTSSPNALSVMPSNPFGFTHILRFLVQPFHPRHLTTFFAHFDAIAYIHPLPLQLMGIRLRFEPTSPLIAKGINAKGSGMEPMKRLVIIPFTQT